MRKEIEYWKEILRIKIHKEYDFVLRKRMVFKCKEEEKGSIDQ